MGGQPIGARPARPRELKRHDVTPAWSFPNGLAGTNGPIPLVVQGKPQDRAVSEGTGHAGDPNRL